MHLGVAFQPGMLERNLLQHHQELHWNMLEAANETSACVGNLVPGQLVILSLVFPAAEVTPNW